MEAILEATTRDTFGKNEARRTRKQGMVPAVLYGASSDEQGKGEGDLCGDTGAMGRGALAAGGRRPISALGDRREVRLSRSEGGRQARRHPREHEQRQGEGEDRRAQ